MVGHWCGGHYEVSKQDQASRLSISGHARIRENMDDYSSDSRCKYHFYTYSRAHRSLLT